MSESPKKSDVLEVRIDHATKREFMDECRKEGLSASEKVREMIDRFLDGRRNAGESLMSTQKRARSRLKLASAAIAALSGAAIVGLQAGQATDITKSIFARKDKDGDKRLTLQEFLPDFSEAITSRSLGQKCRDALVAHATGVETGFFRALDADASGDLSYEEFARNESLPTEEMLRAEFKRGDTNGDGFLSWPEHEALTAPPDIETLKSGEGRPGGKMIAMEFDRHGAEEREVVTRDEPHGDGVKVVKVFKHKGGKPGEEIVEEKTEEKTGAEGERVEIRKVIKRKGGAGEDIETEITTEDGMFELEAPSPEALGPVAEACMPEDGGRADVVFFMGKPKLSSAAFQEADLDKDGKLSFEEFVGG